MNLSAFDQQILQPIANKAPGFPSPDLYQAYDDVLLLSQQIELFEQQRPEDVLFNNSTSQDDKSAAYRISRLMSVLLKAEYMVADIFLSRFIGGLHSQESMSMNTFLAQGNPRYVALGESLLPAYCIVLYRNKLVAHYDFKRMGVYGTSAAGIRTLSPLPDSFHIAEDDVASLKDLRDKYQEKIPALRGIENHYDLLTALFYAVPAGEVRKANPDRNIINQIAEKGGCASKSAREIVVALDVFSSGILRCL